MNNPKFKGKRGKKAQTIIWPKVESFCFTFCLHFVLFCFSVLPLTSLLYVQNNLILAFDSSIRLCNPYFIQLYCTSFVLGPVHFCDSCHKHWITLLQNRVPSILKSLGLTECSFMVDALPFVFQIFCETLKWWPCSTPQLHLLLCGLVDQKVSVTAVTFGYFVVGDRLDSDSSRLPFSLFKTLLIITWLSGIVRGSWSDDVVAKHCIGLNKPFCGWRSRYNSIEGGKQCVIGEVYEHFVVCFFL